MKPKRVKPMPVRAWAILHDGEIEPHSVYKFRQHAEFMAGFNPQNVVEVEIRVVEKLNCG